MTCCRQPDRRRAQAATSSRGFRTIAMTGRRLAALLPPRSCGLVLPASLLQALLAARLLGAGRGAGPDLAAAAETAEAPLRRVVLWHPASPSPGSLRSAMPRPPCPRAESGPRSYREHRRVLTWVGGPLSRLRRRFFPAPATGSASPLIPPASGCSAERLPLAAIFRLLDPVLWGPRSVRGSHSASASRPVDGRRPCWAWPRLALPFLPATAWERGWFNAFSAASPAAIHLSPQPCLSSSALLVTGLGSRHGGLRWIGMSDPARDPHHSSRGSAWVGLPGLRVQAAEHGTALFLLLLLAAAPPRLDYAALDQPGPGPPPYRRPLCPGLWLDWPDSFRESVPAVALRVYFLPFLSPSWQVLPIPPPARSAPPPRGPCPPERLPALTASAEYHPGPRRGPPCRPVSSSAPLSRRQSATISLSAAETATLVECKDCLRTSPSSASLVGGLPGSHGGWKVIIVPVGTTKRYRVPV